MHNQATSPQAIVSKLRECRFFLLLMADYEKMDQEKLSFCVSAFLCVFRSVQYRLLGVVREKHGDEARKTIKRKLGENGEIKFLTDRLDLEIHGDGTIIRTSDALSRRLKTGLDACAYRP